MKVLMGPIVTSKVSLKARNGSMNSWQTCSTYVNSKGYNEWLLPTHNLLIYNPLNSSVFKEIIKIYIVLICY